MKTEKKSARKSARPAAGKPVAAVKGTKAPIVKTKGAITRGTAKTPPPKLKTKPALTGKKTAPKKASPRRPAARVKLAAKAPVAVSPKPVTRKRTARKGTIQTPAAIPALPVAAKPIAPVTPAPVRKGAVSTAVRRPKAAKTGPAIVTTTVTQEPAALKPKALAPPADIELAPKPPVLDIAAPRRRAPARRKAALAPAVVVQAAPVAPAPAPKPLPKTARRKAPKAARVGEEPLAVMVKPSPLKPQPTTPPVQAGAPAPRSRRTIVVKPTRRRRVRKLNLEIPPILLEGDVSPEPAVSGPGRRYELAPPLGQGVPAEPGAPLEPAVSQELAPSPITTAVAQSAEPPPPSAGPLAAAEPVRPAPPLAPPMPVPVPAGEPELPEAYGTGRLTITARDPHWLYAAWDLTSQQLANYNALSRDRHLTLRIYLKAAVGKPFLEIDVHPESRNWFVHVGLGGARYVGELGYYVSTGDWVSVATSKATLTPPDTLAEDTTVQFANLPVEVPLPELVELVKQAVSDNVPLIEALQQLRALGRTDLPALEVGETDIAWTPEQERALAGVISMDGVRQVWIGSLEITELVRRQLERQISSAAAVPAAPPAAGRAPLPEFAGQPAAVSSPSGGAAPPHRGFWFNINAELILYGATESDATVTIAGRVIKLRRDGSFSYRFALPDGRYELPVTAVSVDRAEGRHAALRFSRRTRYTGEVGAHPQDAALQPPVAESVS